MFSTKRNALLFVARLIVGGIFIMTGWSKIGGHDAIFAMTGYFAQMGLPAFMVYVVGYLELIGGILIAIGYFTCKAEGILSVIMLFAIYYSLPMGVAGVSLPLATLGALLALVAVGDGKYAVKAATGL